MNGVNIDDDHVRQQIEYDKDMQPNVAPDQFFSYNSAEGVHVRNVTTKYINEHLPDHQSVNNLPNVRNRLLQFFHGKYY